VDALEYEYEDEIETWLCELDRQWHALVVEAEAAIAEGERRAADIVELAQLEAAQLVADAEAEVARIRLAAVRSPQAAQVLAAADAALASSVSSSDLDALRTAVERLRVELSNVVDAAFDELPAVEATAAALRVAEPDVEPDPEVIVLESPRKRGFLRRLVRR
jgi:hypothetical protein